MQSQKIKFVRAKKVREFQKVLKCERNAKTANNSVASIGDYTMSPKWERKLDERATSLDNQDECQNTRCKYCLKVNITDDDIVSVNVVSHTMTNAMRIPPPTTTVLTINMKYLGPVVINQQHYHIIEDGMHTLLGNLTCPGCLNMYRSVSYTFSKDKIK
jgi:hypothetical protein